MSVEGGTIGNGGNGGAGILIIGSGSSTVVNDIGATISGGAGGSGGYNGSSGPGIEVRSGATITTLTNLGSISGGDVAISNYGSISSINNGGAISGGTGVAVYGDGNLGTLVNSGSIVSTDTAVYVESTIGSIANSGLISSGSTGRGIWVKGGTVGTITNLSGGVIEGDSGIAFSTGSIDSIINYGQITGLASGSSFAGIRVITGSSIGSISNYSTISGADYGIYNSGTIGSIDNYGAISSNIGYGMRLLAGSVTQITNYRGATISGNLYGMRNQAQIDVINNFGTISALNPSGYAIANTGSIGTLNNAQGVGNSSGALKYAGSLPQNYNIIVNSLNSYGSLQYAGGATLTTFGIYGGSLLSKGAYTSVLSGLTAGTNVNATSGMHNGTGWRLVETGVGTGIWDLIADYSATNTLTGLQSNANSLATVYNQQAAAYQAALSYDCQVYDSAGLCVSVGGRYTYAGPSPSSNQ